MKITYKTFLIILSIALFACNDSNNDEPPIENYNILVESYVKDQFGNSTPNYNSSVYIYWGIYSLDIAGYNILANGTLIEGSTIIEPDTIAKINEYGKCVFSFKEINEKMTIIIRNNLRTEEFATASFTNSRKTIHFKHTF